jgi:L-glyceraldehyde 3-phosphate reductase
MQYRRCGRSGILLPAISFGLWHNFGKVDDPKVGRQVLLRAFDRGITHFDLANNYGPPAGAAETFFGKILKRDLAAHRNEILVTTKAGYWMWPGPYGDGGSRKYLLTSLDQSLKRLGLEYVDIFYSHRPDADTPMEETMGALDTAVRQGKALYAGISSYSADQTSEAAAILKRLGTPCLIHQPSYSMLDRWIEQGLLAILSREGIGCAVFCPLAQGLLTGKYLKGIPRGSRAGKPHGFLRPEHITGDKLEKVRQLDELATQRGQTLAQMALAWVLRDSRVTSAIVGASSVKQLEENLAALNRSEFSSEELSRIDRILR